MSIKAIQHNRAVILGSGSWPQTLKGAVMKYVRYSLAVSLALCSGQAASAQTVWESRITTGYGNCTYSETDTEAVFSVVIKFGNAKTGLLNAIFSSRGVALYTYDGNGVLQSSGDIVSGLTLGAQASNRVRVSDAFNKYTVYYGANAGAPWNVTNPIDATAKITILKSKLGSWPAVSVRAVTVAGIVDVLDSFGMAYIGPSTSGGNCTVLSNPEAPPPAVNPKVTMSAPDWDLGELPRGEITELTLAAIKDQLCFTYEGSTAVTNQKYLINATNINGLSSDSRYLLKSLEDSSQTVPYTLTLANSTDSVLLPNIQNRLFSLDAGGKTCFTPTFKAEPDKAIKGGAYSDILTFTVVAKT